MQEHELCYLCVLITVQS